MEDESWDMAKQLKQMVNQIKKKLLMNKTLKTSNRERFNQVNQLRFKDQVVLKILNETHKIQKEFI